MMDPDYVQLSGDEDADDVNRISIFAFWGVMFTFLAIYITFLVLVLFFYICGK